MEPSGMGKILGLDPSTAKNKSKKIQPLRNIGINVTGNG
jgi:hypothetical protein